MSAFNWVDAVLLILIVGSGVSGYMKGLIRSVRSLAAIWGGFITARYLNAAFGDSLDALFGLREQTFEFFSEWLWRAFDRNPISTSMDADKLIELLKIPDVLKTYLVEPVKQVTDTTAASLTQFQTNLVEAIAGKLSEMVAFGVLFFGLWIASAIIYYIIVSLTIPRNKKSLIRKLDKLSGLIVGLLLEIALITIVIGILFPIVSAPEWAMGTPGFLSSGVSDSGLIPGFVWLFQQTLLTWVMPAIGSIYPSASLR